MFKMVPMRENMAAKQQAPRARVRKALDWETSSPEPAEDAGTAGVEAPAPALQEIPEHVETPAPEVMTNVQAKGPRVAASINGRSAESDESPGLRATGTDGRVEQVARNLSDAVGNALVELRKLTTGDQQRMAALETRLAEVSEDILATKKELVTLREQSVTIVHREEQLHSRLEAVDERLSQRETDSKGTRDELQKVLTGLERTNQRVGESAETLRSLNQCLPKLQATSEAILNRQDSMETSVSAATEGTAALEERLTAQATAIRHLHSASQDRGVYLRKVMETLLKLEGLAGTRESSSTLPEGL